MSNCPNCGSNNINYKREKVNTSVKSRGSSFKFFTTTRSNNRNTNFNYHTIGMCKDCGYTFEIATETEAPSKPPLSFWKIFFGIVFFYISIPIWFYKTDKINLPKKTRGIIIAVFAAFMFLVGALSPSSESSTTKPTSTTETRTTTTKTNKEAPKTTVTKEEPKEEEIEVSTPKEVETNTQAATPIVREQTSVVIEQNEASIVEPTEEVAVVVEPVEEETITIVEVEEEPVPVITYMYIVNSNTGKIHHIATPHKTAPENSIYFVSLEEAANAGYTDKCGICFK